MRIKRIYLSIILVFFLLALPAKTLAIYDPLSVANNKFGIHITQESDIRDAASLVNSTGGDWGYITLVIQKGERDFKRWQKTFDLLRRVHLIPLLRLATAHQNGGWEMPSHDEIDGWVNFLDSLNWPINNKYVIINNEPNHAKEWGGQILPESYADYLKKISQRAKAKSDDFFILPAAMDFSAQTDEESLDGRVYLERMLESQPDIFDWVDGWNSHFYPNPNFTGSEKSTGRGTIASFSWELSYLKSLGVSKKLPVFITETGWAHDIDSDNNLLDPEEIGPKFAWAFDNTWNNTDIVAVTPFIFSYQDFPFDIFSWKKPDGSFYPFFDSFKSIEKSKGKPIQENSGEILGALVPPYVEFGQTFSGALLVKNTGQSIWNEEEPILIEDLEAKIKIVKILTFPRMEPFERRLVLFEAIAPEDIEKQVGYLALSKGENVISNAYPFEVRLYKFNNIFKYLYSIINLLSSTAWKFKAEY